MQKLYAGIPHSYVVRRIQIALDYKINSGQALVNLANTILIC